MIIAVVGQESLPDAQSLLHVLEGEFPDATVDLRASKLPNVNYRVSVEQPDSSSFTVTKFDQGQLSCDGTESQDCRVAAAVRAALRDDFPRVVAITDDGSMYVDLVAGITPEEIRTGWRDVAEGGF